MSTPEWHEPHQQISLSFQCGFCDHKVSSPWGWVARDTRKGPILLGVRICPECSNLTQFEHIPGNDVAFRRQFPGPTAGVPVGHLPSDVDALYNQARRCFAVNAHTAAVLALRKLLMHVAVEKKAPIGKNFLEYVEYLDQNHFLGAGGKPWVDVIRKKGNEANHEIVIVSEEDAEDVLAFAEMLLKLVYEFPGRVKPTSPTTS